jgi:hypothetical protein
VVVNRHAYSHARATSAHFAQLPASYADSRRCGAAAKNFTPRTSCFALVAQGKVSGVQQACAGVKVAKKRQREKLKVLLRRAQIRKRVRAIARQIERDSKGESVHLICILKGACIFLADLLRELRIPVSVDFIAVSSYGKTSSTPGSPSTTSTASCRRAGRARSRSPSCSTSPTAA